MIKNHQKREKASWSEVLADELHKPFKRKFQRRQVLVNEIDDVWAADLVELQEWKNVNYGYRYILNVIDSFSKYAWSVPLKNGNGETVLDAFKYIVETSNRKLRYIWVDKGKEFYNKDMTAWLKDENILRYSTHGEHKSAIAERFNRTLEERIRRRFTAENTRNWIDTLDELLSKYNNSYHSTIRMRPVDASKKGNEFVVWENSFKNDEHHKKSSKFKIGETVRISRIKSIFEHGFLPNWSEQIYKIHKINNSSPVTYILKDLQIEIIEGSFYNEELLKTSQEVFRIEKVLRKKKSNGIEHGLVKWIGYSDKFNEWLPVSKLQNIN